jgi:hypothetical protein
MPPPELRPRTLALAVGMLAAGALGQSVRLEERIDAPLLYVSMAATDGEAKAADLRQLLQDPDLLALVGLSDPSRDAVRGGMALRLLRSILASTTGEIELALIGVEPRRTSPDQPLLAFRARLGGGGAAGLRAFLENRERAQPRREVAGRQVFALPAGADAWIEVVLIDDDLLASNHPAAIDRVLEEHTGVRAVLASEPEYRRLRGEQPAASGSLLVFADWRRLEPRLRGLLGVERHWLLDWSGLASTERILLTMRPAGPGVATSVLLQQAAPADAAQVGPDGWLSLVQRTNPRDLVRDLPEQGFAALTVGLDPRRLVTSGLGPRMRGVVARMSGGCRQLGIDLAGQILRPLGETASLQVLLLGADAGGAPSIAYSVRARSAAAARSLFTLSKAELTRAGWADLEKTDGGEVLTLREMVDTGLSKRRDVHLTVVRDALVFALDREALALLQQAGPRKERARIGARLRDLGAHRQDLGGVFSLDVGQWLGRGPGASSDNPLLSSHDGYLQFEPGLIRLEALAVR